MVEFYAACFGVSLLATVALTWFSNSGGSKTNIQNDDFKKFQRSYLIAYVCAMAGDWLQGPYVYALYSSYGYSKGDIATLFVAGFGSSMIFGTIVGSFADKMGRKKMALAYCVIYIASCVTKHFSSYWMLMLGRLLGGIATSLVYSVFDSWMVSEHSAKGFDSNKDLLPDTFSKAMLGNSIVAILSGIVAEYGASIAELTPISESSGIYYGGFTAPFDIAIGALVICFSLISSGWSENYGSKTGLADSGLSTTAISNAFTEIRSKKKILLIGCIGSLFEGSMFTFVFMWTPVMQSIDRKDLPFGLIFATFMICCMGGSSLFSIISKQNKVEKIAFCVFITSCAALSAPYLSASAQGVFLCFLIFEVCVGMYWPSMGTLKGIHVPDGQRAAIYNVFRIPLNAIVLFVLEVEMELGTVFLCVMSFLAAAAVMQYSLIAELKAEPVATVEMDLEIQNDDASV